MGDRFVQHLRDYQVLAQLHHGRDAEPPLNARQADVGAEIERLAHSIEVQGLKVPLLVTQAPDGNAYVVDGDRRLSALHLLAGRGAISDDESIPVRWISYSEAFEASLTANIERRDMHPVDQYEAFARLHEDGANAQQIADRFGLGLRQVQQRLALGGGLHPWVRELWRAGDLDEGMARALTSARDPDHQIDVLKALLEAGGKITGERIRDHIAAGAFATTKAFLFVGEAAYIFAGGRLRHDLFDAPPIVEDPEILAQAAAAKVSELVEAWRGKGWDWVSMSDDLPLTAHAWERIRPGISYTADEQLEIDVLTEQARTVGTLTAAGREIDARLDAIRERASERAFTPAHRQRSGVILRIGSRGEVRADLGVVYGGRVRRTATKLEPLSLTAASPAPASPSENADDDRVDIPARVWGLMQSWQTNAIARTIEENPVLALAIGLAAALRPPALPIQLRPQGAMEGSLIQLSSDLAEADDDDILSEVIERGGAETLLRHHAKVVAASVNTIGVGDARNGAPAVSPDAVTRLIRHLPPATFAYHALNVFDPGTYFDGVRRVHVVAALDEMGVPYEASASKADLAVKAATHAKLFRWLPRVLRMPGFDWVRP